MLCVCIRLLNQNDDVDDENIINSQTVNNMSKQNPYGYTITEPKDWNVPYIRQPPCMPKQQPIVMPVYTDGVPMNALEIVSS